MFLIPAVAMRLWAEERRLGTIELLLTLPVTIPEVIFGKFLAAWLFIGAALVLTFPIRPDGCLSGPTGHGADYLRLRGQLPDGRRLFLSVGSLTSSLTRSQVVSFVLAVVICLFFILAGYPPVTAVLSGWAPLWLVNLVSDFEFFEPFHVHGAWGDRPEGTWCTFFR